MVTDSDGFRKYRHIHEKNPGFDAQKAKKELSGNGQLFLRVRKRGKDIFGNI